MRFKLPVLLPVALLALGSLSACSNEDDDDDDDRPGADAGTDAGSSGNEDSGTHSFPDAGTDPGVSPTAACPAGAIFCEPFTSPSGWTPSATNASIAVEGGRLHVLTQNGHDEKVTPGVRAIAQWTREIPAFTTQLWVRAHVFLPELPGDFGQMGTFFVLVNLASSDFGGFELQVIRDSGFALDDWSLRPGQGWRRQGPPVNLGMSTDRWVCLEWEVRRSSSTSTHGNARVYVDGTLAHDFMDIGMRSFTNFSVGWGFVHPQGPSGSEAWIDNLAIGTTRMGCQ